MSRNSILAFAIFMAVSVPGVAGGFNPRDFGAKADGVSDDTAALRACFAAAAAAGGGSVTIPPGGLFPEGRDADTVVFAAHRNGAGRTIPSAGNTRR
jgi:hypothetical protein